jgi:16S rRNA processing protein RimM
VPADLRERVVLATITRPHGLRGAVRAKVFNEDTEVLHAGARVWLVFPDGTERAAKVANAQPAKETWMIALDDVTTVEGAEALRGVQIAVDRTELPALEDGEFYHADLVGCRVLEANGTLMGTVRDVIQYPSVDALVVDLERGGELEVPVVEGIVVSVDVPGGTIVVDPEMLEGG